MSLSKRLAISGISALLFLITILTSGAQAQGVYKSLHKFTGGSDGIGPSGSLIFDQSGNLYGTTQQGGSGSGCFASFTNCGTVFELTPNSKGGWTEKVLYDFCSLTNCADGAEPTGGLIFDREGNLYGTTDGSGTFGFGTVFELSPSGDGSWTEKVLHQFTGATDGGAPAAGLIFDQAGNLYGTAFQGGTHSQCIGGIGCGLVFQLTPNLDGSWTETVLYSFAGSPDGSNPFGGLIFDTAGSLYGTTYYGGASGSSCTVGGGGCGTVFMLKPSAGGMWTETVLHSFLEPTGAYPQSDLVFDQAGNLYGTTQQGGNLTQCRPYSGCGLVYQLVPSADGSWKEKVLHHFDGLRQGGLPVASLTLSDSGNLYGTTVAGGVPRDCPVNNPVCSVGVVFKLAPNAKGGWTETVLHPFYDRPGGRPFGGVLFDAAGNLYGTTMGDLTTTFGSVFEITP